jgi:hypothetical protein
VASAVALDTSPITLLRSLRGTVVDARIAHPEVLHVEIHDPHGRLWRLATQDAAWSPPDVAQLVGQSIDSAEIDETTGRLRCELSSKTVFEIKPEPGQDVDDPPSWELISPEGLVLEFGPGVRWQISGADAPVSARR